jgi:hypothetical protein
MTGKNGQLPAPGSSSVLPPARSLDRPRPLWMTSVSLTVDSQLRDDSIAVRAQSRQPGPPQPVPVTVALPVGFTYGDAVALTFGGVVEAVAGNTSNGGLAQLAAGGGDLATALGLAALGAVGDRAEEARSLSEFAAAEVHAQQEQPARHIVGDARPAR